MWLKRASHATQRGGAAAADGVKEFSVVRHHIFDVCAVFESPLNLKGGDTGCHQPFKMPVKAQVAQRQKMFVAHYGSPRGVNQVVTIATRLNADASVGAPSGEVFAQEAPAAERYAQRSVYKKLQRHRGVGANLRNLL
jgi:hypothetical protein